MSKHTSIAMGLIIAFGIPYIFWLLWGWKAAIIVLILGQGFIYFARAMSGK